MKGFIYIIKNSINNKVYIGQTKVSVETRWKEHVRHARYGNQVINRAMKKYGINVFFIELLEICKVEDVDKREVYYIELYDSTNKFKGYNVSIGGNTPKLKRTCLDINVLSNLYIKENWTLEKIANKYNVSRYIISTELKNAGIIVRKRYESSAKFDKIDKQLLIDNLLKGRSIRNAAKLSNIPYNTFRKACIHNNIEYNSSTSARHL